MASGVDRFLAAAAAGGRSIEVATFPDGTRTAQDAADAIGCAVSQIVKSLVFTLDAAPVLALVAGDNRLDEALLATALGGEEVGRADAEMVRATTGYAIGGVPPFGHASPLPTVVDEDLLTHPVVWAAAGTPRDVFAIEPAALVDITGGVVAAVARR